MSDFTGARRHLSGLTRSFLQVERDILAGLFLLADGFDNGHCDVGNASDDGAGFGIRVDGFSCRSLNIVDLHANLDGRLSGLHREGFDFLGDCKTLAEIARASRLVVAFNASKLVCPAIAAIS
nr:hypothetical protein [Bradyrhizobium sp. CCBAU 21362]